MATFERIRNPILFSSVSPKGSGSVPGPDYYHTLLLQTLGDTNTVANYQLGVGLSGTTNATAWANALGAAPALAKGDANGPAIQADGSLLFNGTSHYMTMATTLVQPTTIYMVARQVTWTITDVLFDGATVTTGQLIQTTTTPQLNISAGTSVAANTTLAVNTYGIITVIFNGASSSLQIDNNTATTGNAGAGNMGGLTLGASATPGLYGNIQVKEIIIRKVADSAAMQANIKSQLQRLHGTP